MSGAESSAPPQPIKVSKIKSSSSFMAEGWSALPSNLLERILIRLERDDVARYCAVCRRWNRIVSSEFFQWSYRKQHRTLAWTWLCTIKKAGAGIGIAHRDEQQHGDHERREEDKEVAASASGELVAWNLHFKRSYKLLEIAACPASRCHPKHCWFDFATADGMVAWACRHTPSSIRVGDPLRPSSIRALPDLPPFAESIVYEFRLALWPEHHEEGGDIGDGSGGAGVDGGFKLAVLRLGWPHGEGTASVCLSASVYRSATRRWTTSQVKVGADLKRWGAAVVCKGLIYVLLRPSEKNGHSVKLLSFNLAAAGSPPPLHQHQEMWSYQDVPLPDSAAAYSWSDALDLVDRAGTLMLVIFSHASKSIAIYQAEEVAGGGRMLRAAPPGLRWVLVSAIPRGVCVQFCEGLETPWSYRCRATSDYVFVTSDRGGAGFVYTISRKSWHRIHVAGIDATRYVFALSI